jgi:hypothetical protein
MNHLAALADKTINPNGTMPDVYAVAPYISGTTVSALTSSITSAAVPWIKADLTCSKMIGVPLISYEGGSDSFSASDCQSVQTDPGMHDVYTSYLTAIFGAGLTGPFMQYTHAGSCWGMKVATSNSSASSPKYQGLLDWLATHQ